MDLPPSVKDAAAAIEDAWQKVAPASARWVPRDNLHVTMKFLGPVADERTHEIAGAVAGAVDGMVDFSVRLGETGAFPSVRRARVLWVGLEDPAGGLGMLAAAVEEAMAPLGFEPENRPFTAHLTVARLKVPRAVSLVAGAPGEPFLVDRLTLFQSVLRRPAPRYEALATFPFRRAPERPAHS